MLKFSQKTPFSFRQLFFAIFSLRFSAGMVWIRDGFETFVLGWAFFLGFSKNWSFLKRLREGALYHLKLWHGSFDRFLFGLQFQIVKKPF